MRININGDIIRNDDKWVYDWLDYESTAPKDIHDALAKAGGTNVEVYINSGGGDVFSGTEIYEALRDYAGKVTIHVIFAASAASVIMCARQSVISPTGMVMVHNVSGAACGDYHDMDKGSEILKKANKAVAAAYTTKTGKTEAEVLKMMDKETWLTGQEAVDAGLVDAVSVARLVAAGPQTVPPAVIDQIKAHLKGNRQQTLAADMQRSKLNLLRLKGVLRNDQGTVFD